MGSARFELIIDFYRHEVDVALRCDGCKHTRFLIVQQVGRIFGIEERIAKCAKRLVRSHRGHKGGRMTPIPKLALGQINVSGRTAEALRLCPPWVERYGNRPRLQQTGAVAVPRS